MVCCHKIKAKIRNVDCILLNLMGFRIKSIYWGKFSGIENRNGADNVTSGKLLRNTLFTIFHSVLEVLNVFVSQ